MKLHVLKAEHCAWRGRYLNVNDRQVARITLDPTASRGPQLSVAFGLGNFANMVEQPLVRRVLWALHFSGRCRLPHIPYRWAARYPALLPLFRVSNRFWHGLDGRYTKA